MTDFCFSYDWLRGWRDFSGPVTERSQKAKAVKSQISFDTRSKIVYQRSIMEHTQISSDNENWNKYNYGWKRELLKLL